MPILPLYTSLRTPEEMRAWDEHAEKALGISQTVLMENAAREAFFLLRDRVPPRAETRVLIIMGRGNNGGDGASLARHLHQAGYTVLVLHSGSLDDLRGAAADHARMARGTGVCFRSIASNGLLGLNAQWARPDVVVDALLGTGIAGELRPRELALVQAMNEFREQHAFIFALDTPSGLCGYSGRPKPEAVRAHLTVSFEDGKPGLFFPEAKPYTGEVRVMPIGLPVRTLEARFPPSWRLLAPAPGPWALPDPQRHKGTAGKVLIIGGSPGMPGAPALAALGALRAGARLVHAACPEGLEHQVRCGFPELLTHGLGLGPDWREHDADAVARLLERLSPGAVVIGPGLGRGKAARAILQAVLEVENRCPAILDADSLSFFRLPTASGEAEEEPVPPLSLSLLRPDDILTPHPGEMARLLPRSFYEGQGAAGQGPDRNLAACILVVQEDRPGVIRAFTRACPAVLVLKGPGTLIGQAGNPVTLAPFADSVLGVGGSGDVLSGVIAALAASRSARTERGTRRCFSSLDAACLGVYLHGRSGALLSVRSPYGHLARDIAGAVPLAWKELCAL